MEVINVKHIVSLSGGKDSTAMLLRMLEEGLPVDEIIFLDTGMEFPGMYGHLDKVEQHIGRKITRLQNERGTFMYWFAEHVKTKGKRKGDRGYGWPSSGGRWCTARLKQDVLKRSPIAANCIEYHGIAADELHRTGKNAGKEIRYPLVEWEMTEADCLKYCYDQGFDWGGLYEDFQRASCWCCPLQRVGELRTLYNKYPDLWKELEYMDSIAPNFNEFKSGKSVAEWAARFEAENK